MIFVIIFSILLIIGLLHNRNNDSALWNLALVCMVCFNGLKDYFLFSDQAGYAYELSSLDFEVSRTSFSFEFFVKMFHAFSSNYTLFSLLIGLIVYVSYSKLLKRYSCNKWLSLCIFIVTNYVMSMLAIRQYLAMSFCVLALLAYLDKKHTQCAVLFIIANGFHITAIIFLPILIIDTVELDKKRVIILLLLSIAAIVVFQFVASYFLTNFGGAYAFYGDDYDVEDKGGSWGRNLMKVYILLLYLFTLQDDAYKKGINRIVFYSMLFSVIVCIGGMGLFGIFRLREYFIIGELIGIPQIWYYSNRNSAIMKGLIENNNYYYMSTFKQHIIRFAIIVYLIALCFSFFDVIQQNFINGYRYVWES